MEEETPDELREKPRCVMIALCESVVEDKFSNKKVLYGLFNRIVVETTPISGMIVVIGSFAEGRGNWKLTLRIKDPKNQVVFKFDTNVEFSSPVEVYDYTFRVDNLPVTVPGEYDVDFFIDGEPISHRSFRVNLSEMPSKA